MKFELDLIFLGKFPDALVYSCLNLNICGSLYAGHKDNYSRYILSIYLSPAKKTFKNSVDDEFQMTTIYFNRK